MTATRDTIQNTMKEWADETQEEISARRRQATEHVVGVAKNLPYALLGSVVAAAESTRETMAYTFGFPLRAYRAVVGTPEQLRRTFEDRVERGHKVVARVQGRDALERASDQAASARAKMKGAATSSTRAAKAALTAVEEAAESAFDPQDTRPYEERTYEELRALASDRDIAGRSSMNKKALIAALRENR